MLETKIEQHLVREVNLIGGQALKLNTSKRGMPDRLVLLPGGRTVFVELKAPGEKPRPLQLKRIADLKNLGFTVKVIDSMEQVDRFVKGVITCPKLK